MFIELQDVTKYYGKFKAVDSLSFNVEEGDVYGFLGPNGSGKSTSIRMLLSLIRPSSGTIKLFDKEITFQKNDQIRRIGALIETPDFYQYLSAKRNLKILGKLSEVERLDKRVDEVLDTVGLAERGHSKVKTFSKGMKQRLGIAQALLHKPDLIILDEPTAGLDPHGQKEIRALINSLRKNHNITILISSHLLFEIEQIASRMIIINKGKKLVEGSVMELIHNREQHVSFKINEAEKTKKLILESRWNDKFSGSEGEKFNLVLSRKEISEFNSFLINSGAMIYAIEPIRSLEDFFLQITENEAAD